MSLTAQIFIALLGAALLGAACCWSFFWLKMALQKKAVEKLLLEQAVFTEENERLATASETLQHNLAAQQSLLHDVENQYFEMEKNWWNLQAVHDKLTREHQKLKENPEEKIREIEVIREVPVLIFRQPANEDTRREKAKKLVRAFKKGYLDRELSNVNGTHIQLKNEPDTEPA